MIMRSEPNSGGIPFPKEGKRTGMEVSGFRYHQLILTKSTPRSIKTRRRLVGALIAAVVVIGVAVDVVSQLISNHNREMAAADEFLRVYEEASIQAAEEAASAQAAEEAALTEEEEQKERQERQDRRESVTQIEESAGEMATGHVEDGVLDGEVLRVDCSPVAGGSVDDLTEKTTVFDCFVSTEENDNGTNSGYSYHATVNWDSGHFTYGLGPP